MVDTDDRELISLCMVELATSSASLDRSPKKNWVENSGSLPPYIRKLARAIEKSGRPLSSAIAIAISRVKKWAAGGDNVNADTRAKAAKALAQWETLKAKNKAKKLVKASRNDESEYLMFSNTTSYNTEIVRAAWDDRIRAQREAERKSSQGGSYSEEIPYSWVKELWTDYIIVGVDGPVSRTVRVPYEVDADRVVIFGDSIPVEQHWVDTDDELDPEDKELLSDILVP